MREVPVSAFLPMLRTMVNVPVEPLMESAVVEAAIAFCRKSSVLLHQREMAHVYHGQTISLLAKSGMNRRTRGLLKSSKLLSITANCDGITLESGKDYRQLSLDEVYFLKAFDDVVINCVMEPLTGTSYVPASLLDDWEAGFVRVRPRRCCFNQTRIGLILLLPFITSASSKRQCGMRHVGAWKRVQVSRLPRMPGANGSFSDDTF